MEFIFWITIILGLNWAAALLYSFINPDWYYSKAIMAGVSGNLSRFRIIKIFQLGICVALCIWSGQETGIITIRGWLRH